MEEHEFWMRHALSLARVSEQEGEVPVGAVIVQNKKMIAVGSNQPIALNDPTAHAEITTLRRACQGQKNYRLPEAILYVTLEPCPMCVGAMIHARIKHVIFGAHDPKTGAAGSIFSLAQAKEHNHRMEVTGGVLEDECSEILQKFFRARR